MSSAPNIERRQEVFGEIPDTPGEVTVRALTLTDWLDMADLAREKKHSEITEALARCVVDRNGNQLRSVEQWEVWGGQHRIEVLALYTKMIELGEPAEKKESPPS